MIFDYEAGTVANVSTNALLKWFAEMWHELDVMGELSTETIQQAEILANYASLED